MSTSFTALKITQEEIDNLFMKWLAVFDQHIAASKIGR